MSLCDTENTGVPILLNCKYRSWLSSAGQCKQTCHITSHHSDASVNCWSLLGTDCFNSQNDNTKSAHAWVFQFCDFCNVLVRKEELQTEFADDDSFYEGMPGQRLHLASCTHQIGPQKIQGKPCIITKNDVKELIYETVFMEACLDRDPPSKSHKHTRQTHFKVNL